MPQRKVEAAWIESRKRWQINVQIEGERRTFTSSTPGRKGKIEAEKKADHWLESRLIGEATRCEVLLDQWMEHVKTTTSKSHSDQQECYVRLHLKPAFGHKKIGRLTENDIQNVIDRAYSKGLARKTLTNIRGCCSSFLKWCRGTRCTTLRPENIKIPNGAKKSDRGVIDPDDLKILFTSDTMKWRDKTIPAWDIHAYRFAVLTGVRPGELLGLQWQDYHGDWIKICRSFNDEGEITSGKNENAKRILYLGPLAIAEIEAQKKMLADAGIKSIWIFPFKDGSRTTQETYRRYWRAYKKANGIKKGTPYEMRHTFVSVNKEMPEGLKKLAIGHTEDMDTEGTYGHEMAGDLERAAEYSEAAFRRVLGLDKEEEAE